jgi:hypothetical protein
MADFAADFRAAFTPVIVPFDGMDYVAVFAPRVSDGVPPRLTVVSPAEGSTIGHTAALHLRLVDMAGFALRDLWIGFGQTPTSYELMHDGTSFRGAYAAGSSEAPIVGGWEFVVSRLGGWPYGHQIRLRANVVDVGGNVVVVDA